VDVVTSTKCNALKSGGEILALELQILHNHIARLLLPIVVRG